MLGPAAGAAGLGLDVGAELPGPLHVAPLHLEDEVLDRLHPQVLDPLPVVWRTINSPSANLNATYTNNIFKIL